MLHQLNAFDLGTNHEIETIWRALDRDTLLCADETADYQK